MTRRWPSSSCVLQRLTGLVRDKIVVEYYQILIVIERLRSVSCSAALFELVIREELQEMVKPVWDVSRLKSWEAGDIARGLIAIEVMVVTISRQVM